MPCDPLRGQLCLAQPKFGELQLSTAAKSLGFDSGNVPVAHEHDAHDAGVQIQPECSAADFSTSPSTRKSANVTSWGVQTAL